MHPGDSVDCDLSHTERSQGPSPMEHSTHSPQGLVDADSTLPNNKSDSNLGRHLTDETYGTNDPSSSNEHEPTYVIRCVHLYVGTAVLFLEFHMLCVG